MIERIEDLQCRGYKIIQDTEGFCFGMDAVLLSEFTRTVIQKNSRICDLCTGNGIIPILLAAKTEAEELIGIEIQERAADLAKRSVKLNQEEKRIKILQEDIRQIDQLGLEEYFDVVSANPPYMNAGIKNQNEAKLIARHEITCTFQDVASAAYRILKYKGKFCLVHRPNRLAELIVTLKKNQLEPKRLRMVHSYADRDANLFLLEAVKGGRSQMTVEPPLVVYQKPGQYTEELNRIYGRLQN